MNTHSKSDSDPFGPADEAPAGPDGPVAVPVEPAAEVAPIDLGSDPGYGDYLHLDRLLSAQHPLGTDHEEMLFIVQHQSSELWMKLLLHELHAAMRHIAADQLHPSLQMLARIGQIMGQLAQACEVLATMTPPACSAVRPYLANSSGFQSWQFRCIEFGLGHKHRPLLKAHAQRPDLLAHLEAAWRSPSLYDEALRLLARRGLSVPATHTLRDWTLPYAESAEVEAAWLQVYRKPEAHRDLHQLGEKLTDVETAFRLWRFRQVTTVERVIGFQRGTGGGQLRKLLDVVLFPEIWRLRTAL